MYLVLIADIIIAVIIIFKLVGGWRKGFVRAFSGLIAMICASFGSMAAKDWLSPYISDSLLLPSVKNFFSTRLGMGSGAISSQVDSFLENIRLPQFTKGILSEKITEKIAQTGSGLLQAAAETVSLKLSEILVFAVCFIIIYFVVRALIRLLDKTVFKVPVIRQCNKLLGAVIGLLAGAVIAFVLLTVAYMFFPILSQEGAILSPESVSHAYLVKLYFETFPGVFS